MLHPRRSRVLACVLLLLLASGCAARQSKEQYAERLAAAGKARQQVAVQVNGDQLTSQGSYAQAANSLRAAAKELDTDLPPKDVEPAHDAMVDHLEGFADLVERLADCEGGSERERSACRAAIPQETFDEVKNDFDEANTIYREEGFSVPGSGDEEGAGDDSEERPKGGDEL